MKPLVWMLLLLCCPIILNAQDKTALLKKTTESFRKEDFKKAASYSETLSEKFPQEEDGFYWLGLSNYKLNKYDKSFAAFTKAIQINNKNTYIYFYRAKVLAMANKSQDAINDLNMAIKYNTVDSMTFHLYLFRSGERSSVRDFEGVISDSYAALKEDSASIDAMSNLAMALNETGKGEEAIRWLQKIVSIDSSSFVIFQNIGFILSGMERYQEAMIYFDKAIHASPDEAFPYSNRGHVKMKMKDYEGALQDINKSIKLNSGNSYAYRNRALVHLEMKDPARACKDLETARKLGFDKLYGDEVNHLIAEKCK
ncbi:MAG: tetratricopeptide repeat protein [Bacteroidota bacterium]